MLLTTSFALTGTGMWAYVWRCQAPKVLAAHEAALAQAIAEGEFDIGGTIHVRMENCVVHQPRWARLIRPFRVIPVRQQDILWRDPETGVITELCLQTTLQMKPGVCVLSSTKPVAEKVARLAAS